jgi:hypothetical protein
MTFSFKIRINKSCIIIEKNENSLIRNVNSTCIHLNDQGTYKIVIYKLVVLDNSNFKGYIKFIDLFYFQIRFIVMLFKDRFDLI